jgi:HEPN domain-containing protein
MPKQTEYWLKEAFDNYETAQILMNNKKYIEAAFFCHLALEKIIKAFITDRTKQLPPKSHSLLLLLEKASLKSELGEEQMDFLANMNLYQIEGRYPGDREVLYQQTSVDEFNDIFKRTGVELEWLKQKLKSEQ